MLLSVQKIEEFIEPVLNHRPPKARHDGLPYSSRKTRDARQELSKRRRPQENGSAAPILWNVIENVEENERDVQVRVQREIIPVRGIQRNVKGAVLVPRHAN